VLWLIAGITVAILAGITIAILAGITIAILAGITIAILAGITVASMPCMSLLKPPPGFLHRLLSIHGASIDSTGRRKDFAKT